MPAPQKMKGIITVDWDADPEHDAVITRDGVSFIGHQTIDAGEQMKRKLSDTADASMIATGQPVVGLREADDSHASRWSINIETATVHIEEITHTTGETSYGVTIEVARADAGTTVIRPLAHARTYDDARIGGVTAARALAHALGIIDHADSMVQAAEHALELRLRASFDREADRG